MPPKPSIDLRQSTNGNEMSVKSPDEIRKRFKHRAIGLLVLEVTFLAGCAWMFWIPNVAYQDLAVMLAVMAAPSVAPWVAIFSSRRKALR